MHLKLLEPRLTQYKTLNSRHYVMLLVYGILNNLIDSPDLLSEIGFHIPCIHTRNLDLFVFRSIIPTVEIVRYFQEFLFWPIRYQLN